jgi:cytochrome b pre-mRNA-processing protein 3
MLGAKVAPSPTPVNRRGGRSIVIMILERLFGRSTEKRDRRTPAERLYGGAVQQARSPAFFGAGRFSDTVEGRFEALALHGFLVLHRLKSEGEAGRALAQQFFDAMFVDMDRNLREIGIGDLAVGKRIKLLAENFYGRIKSYEEGLGGSDGALEAAVARNLLTETAVARVATGVPPIPPFAAAMAVYIRQEAAALATQSYRSLAEGRIAFGPPPQAGAAP